MAPGRKGKSLAEQIAELNDPTPKDFDPEDVDLRKHANSDSDSDDDQSDDGGREHYETVGKSKLRKPAAVSLGPQYAGSKVSRNVLDESESDDPFSRDIVSDESNTDDDPIDGTDAESGTSEEAGHIEEDPESDEEELNGFATEDDEEDETNGLEDGSEEDDESDDGEFDQPEQVDLESLRKLKAQDQKQVASTLTKGVKTEVDKGQAVKLQRAAFDSVLNVRIKLQKALVSINSLATVDRDNTNTDATEAMQAAEQAAMNLWSNLNSLRSSLEENRTGKKRKYSEIQSTNALDSIWRETQEYEANAKKYRNARLDFWYKQSKTVTARNQQKGLASNGTQSTLSDVLVSHLSDIGRLVAKTRVPRSCAPIQAAAVKKSGTKDATEQVQIFDDADFYGPLLQSLIAQRSADSAALSALNVSFPSQPWQAAREAKTKKVVDTRASKGRKLRYNVHEKLQNFMAPEDRTVWQQRQCDEFFGSLFGKKLELDEDNDLESEDEEQVATEGLRLFASA